MDWKHEGGGEVFNQTCIVDVEVDRDNAKLPALKRSKEHYVYEMNFSTEAMEFPYT